MCADSQPGCLADCASLYLLGFVSVQQVHLIIMICFFYLLLVRDGIVNQAVVQPVHMIVSFFIIMICF